MRGGDIAVASATGNLLNKSPLTTLLIDPNLTSSWARIFETLKRTGPEQYVLACTKRRCRRWHLFTGIQETTTTPVYEPLRGGLP